MSTVQGEDGCHEGRGENAVQPENVVGTACEPSEDNKDLSDCRDAIRYNILCFPQHPLMVILGDTARCLKPPVDFKTKVPNRFCDLSDFVTIFPVK